MVTDLPWQHEKVQILVLFTRSIYHLYGINGILIICNNVVKMQPYYAQNLVFKQKIQNLERGQFANYGITRSVSVKQRNKLAQTVH